MKICFLGGTRYSRPLNTTAEKKFRAMRNLGELFVIAFSQDGRPHRFTQHAHFYLLPKLPVPVLRYAEMFTLGPLLALYLVLRHGVQVLVTQSPYEGFAGALVKQIAGRLGREIVLVVESHGDFEEGLFMQRRLWLPGLYRFLMRRAACFSLQHADLLRCVSNTTRQQLERLVQGKPIIQFPTWTDIEIFLDASVMREGSEDEKTILYAGVLIPRKGLHFLLDAFAAVAKELPNTKLRIIGSIDNPQYAKGLKDQVSRLGLDERVTFLNAMPQHQLAKEMARAHVFVLPTQSEGLPRVVFEAMATGTPVVASAVSGIPEVVEDGVTGFLVSPGDVPSLADRLRWLLRHPQEAQKMGRHAHQFAREFFSRERYVQNYATLFALADQLLEARKRWR